MDRTAVTPTAGWRHLGQSLPQSFVGQGMRRSHRINGGIEHAFKASRVGLGSGSTPSRDLDVVKS